MDYPLPIDAAGRTILVILCLDFLRLEGVIWVHVLLGSCMHLFARLESCARFDPLRLAARRSLAILRAVGGLSLLVLIFLWSTYALIRLAEELAMAPALAIFGGSVGIGSWWAIFHRAPRADLALHRLAAPPDDLNSGSGAVGGTTGGSGGRGTA